MIRTLVFFYKSFSEIYQIENNMELIHQVSCDYELEEKHHVDEGNYFSPIQHHHSTLGTQT